MRFFFFLIPFAAAVFAQKPSDLGDRLVRAREILIDREKRLPDYTCVQTVDRQYFKAQPSKHSAHACDQIRLLPRSSLVLESTDRLRLEVKVSRGEEIGSWPGSQFTSSDIFQLIGSGPYETGMLGPLILDIFANPGASYGYLGDQSAAGASVSIFAFQIPVASSHYHIKSGSDWPVIGYSGAFWLDSGSQELKRLITQSHELPPETHICETATGVDYQKVRVGTGDFLLPQRCTIRMATRDGTVTQSTAVYSGCREYHAESAIRFDAAPATAEAARSAHPQTILPEGLWLSLETTKPIDTETAAAGDIVNFKLRKPVRDPKTKRLLAPAGAAVQGRILGMHHYVKRPARFTIDIALESLETGGALTPLFARFKRPSTGPRSGFTLQALAIAQARHSPAAAPFVFMTDQPRYQVPAGHQSDWETIKPPTQPPAGPITSP